MNLKWIKILYHNITITVLLLLIINIVSILIYNLYKQNTDSLYLNNKKKSAFKDYEWAEQYFEDDISAVGMYKPYVGFVEDSLESKTINVTKEGIRFSTNHNDIPDILFVGGSTMFGRGSTDELTIPSIVSKLSQKKLSVKNMGNTANNSFQGLIKLQSEILLNKTPKYFVSYEGVNELNISLIKGQKFQISHPYEKKFSEKLNKNVRTDKSDDFILKDYFLNLNNPSIKLIKKILSRFIYNNSLDSKYLMSEKDIQSAGDKLIRVWELEYDICKENGIKFLCVLQPEIYVAGEVNNNGIKENISFKKIYPILYEYILNRIEQNEKLKNNFINLSKVFDGDSRSIFYDHCHLTPLGNEIISKFMYKKLIEL